VIKYLSIEQILFIHKRAVETYGGSPGLRDRNLLESAIARPRTSAFGQDAYPSLLSKAAALLHSIVKNHPFIDGNKRTAFGAMHIMLLANGHDLTSTTDEEVDMCLKVAKSELSEGEIAEWITLHSKTRKKGNGKI